MSGFRLYLDCMLVVGFSIMWIVTVIRLSFESLLLVFDCILVPVDCLLIVLWFPFDCLLIVLLECLLICFLSFWVCVWEACRHATAVCGRSMLCYDCGAIVATNIVNLSNTVVPVVALFVLVCGRGFCVYLCAFGGSGSVSSFFFCHQYVIVCLLWQYVAVVRDCLLIVWLSFDCVVALCLSVVSILIVCWSFLLMLCGLCLIVFWKFFPGLRLPFSSCRMSLDFCVIVCWLCLEHCSF